MRKRYASLTPGIGVAENYLGAEKDALRVTVQDFSGDLDLTDIAITADMVVYGH